MFICVGCVGCSSGHSWAPELRRPEGCSCGHCCWEGNSPPLINLWLTIEWSLFGQEIIFPPQSFQLLFLHWLRTSWIPCGKYISALISWAEEPQFLSWFQCTYTDDVQSICLVGLVLLIDWTGWGDPCRHCMRPGAREACNKPYESASKSIYLPLLSPWFVLGFSLQIAMIAYVICKIIVIYWSARCNTGMCIFGGSWGFCGCRWSWRTHGKHLSCIPSVAISNVDKCLLTLKI